MIEESEWRSAYEPRLRARLATCSPRADWVEQQVRRRLSQWDQAGDRAVLEVDGGRVALRATPQSTWQLVDVFIEPQQRGRGRGRRALDTAIAWVAAKTERLTAFVPEGDPVLDALFGAWAVSATDMLKQLPSRAEAQALRPLTEEEFEQWEATLVEEYAQEMTQSGFLPPDQALARARTQHAEFLPHGRETEGHAFAALESAGEAVAFVWLSHEFNPGTSWVHKVEVDAAHRGKGFGRAAMLAAERIALAAGDTQIGLTVWGHNAIAAKLYRSLGYRAVDVGRTLELKGGGA